VPPPWAPPPSRPRWTSPPRRPDPPLFCLPGTARDTEADTDSLPLRATVRELRAHDRCRVLELRLLTATDVATYLAARLPGRGLPPRLSQVLYERTEGDPFFLINLLIDLLCPGLLLY